MMPVPRCDQCRFWEQWGPDAGNCRLSASGQLEGVQPESRKFRAQDVSSIDSILETRADFGCVQWERKA